MLPLFVLGSIVEHWLSLEGRLGATDILSPAYWGTFLAVTLILGKARRLRRQRREAEVGPEPQTEAAL